MPNNIPSLRYSGASIAALSLGLMLGSPAYASAETTEEENSRESELSAQAGSAQDDEPSATAAADPPEQIVGSEDEFNTIIVTAQRRAENIQDVPIAISAYDSEFLAENIIDNVYDLALYTPSLNVNTIQGGGISIRGIAPAFSGAFTNNPVAVYVDGVFQGTAGSDAFLFGDVASVEVLRGPQGTLYGRNATSGAININNRLPTNDWSGLAEGYVTYGESIGIGPSYTTKSVRAAVRGPLVEDALLFSVMGIYRDQGDYVRNFVRNENSNGPERYDIRSQLLITPGNVFDFRVIFDYSKTETDRFYFADKNNSLIQSFVPPLRAPPSEAYQRGGTAAGQLSYSERYTWGLSGQGDIYLTDQITLTSITAYREAESDGAFDIDGTSIPLILSGSRGDPIPADQFSQELRANYAGDRLNLVTGAFYWDENTLTRPGVGVNASISTNAWALFAEGTYDLSEALALTAGLRFSSERKNVDYDPPVAGIPPAVTGEWDSWTPRLVLEYEPREDLLMYASVSKGFKSGGFGFTGQVVEPETLWSYEVGAKADFFRKLMRVNAAAFYMDYTNLQVRTPSPLFPGTFTIDNAAAATVWGIEIESLIRPARNWLASFAASYLNSRYDDFESLCGTPAIIPCNLAGNELIAAPPWKLSGMVQYAHPFSNGSEITFRTTAQYESATFASEFNRPQERVNKKFDLSAYITWNSPDDTWEISVFGTNLTDHQVDYGNIFIPLGLSPVPILAVYPGFERQWGARVGFRF